MVNIPKYLFSLLLIGLFFHSFGQKPNIVLIITDDQGYGDLGYHNNTVIKTPNIDQLANKSVRFSRFYVSPVCAPTRASLMTGRYSLRTGVYDTYNGGSLMASNEITLAELLKLAGYATGHFGKWHLGDNYPYRPQDQGFDEVLMHGAGGIGQPGDQIENFKRWHDSSYFDPVLHKNGESVKTNGYCTDIFTDAALGFIRQQAEEKKPFFAYISYNAPHEPHILPEAYNSLYSNADINAIPQPAVNLHLLNSRHIEEARKVYGMVTHIDEQVGKILKQLNHLKIEENTLVIFMSDNGPWLPRYNAGLRGLKGSVYDGGIKTPFFMYYPANFKGGSEVRAPACHMDILPTLLDIVGYEIPNNIDGKSLLPLIKGENPAWANERYIILHHQRGYLSPYFNVATLQGPYKLVGNGPYFSGLQNFELYHLENDFQESVDISAAFPDKVKELKNVFDDWFKEVQASPNLHPLPIHIGSVHENPVVLTRNDMRGTGGKKWTAENTSGYWDILVENPGFYNVKLTFLNPIHKPSVSIRFNTSEYKLEHTQDNSPEIMFPGVYLEKGRYDFSAWYEFWAEGGPQVITPFYIELNKQ